MKTLFERIAPAAVGVKICGITNPEDMDLCLEAGADALGFNFYHGSKRFIEIEKERDWLRKVPDSVLRVAVVVNPTREEALSLLSESFIDAIQLHGNEDLDFCEMLAKTSGKEVIKAVRVQSVESLAALGVFADFPVLLDAFAGHEMGGTGTTFNWEWLENLPKIDRILLSGGLNSENVASALRRTNVRYVDVASGVEKSPRKKSATTVRQFLSQVHKSHL